MALFDYDPLTMSPNPDAAEEELPFKEGQIIKVGAWLGVMGRARWGGVRGEDGEGALARPKFLNTSQRQAAFSCIRHSAFLSAEEGGLSRVGTKKQDAP